MDHMGSDGISEYDGCGKCLVGVVRLSRVTDATNSPEKQRGQVAEATKAVGGHLIGWAEDLEVSGAMDPLTRPQLGPWLRGERGDYDGIVGAAVCRIGRNVRDVLNTAWMINDRGGLVITHGHDGPWNLDDVNDENNFQMAAWGAQMELRAIQKRNREETVRARAAGIPKNRPAYGYRFVRLIPTGGIHHVEIDPVAAAIIREVAERILSDESGKITCQTEAVRLTRAGVLSPDDHRRVMYGRKPKGGGWTPLSIKGMLTSEAALGYLIHNGRAVVGPDGGPRRLAEGLWDQPTHDALKLKTAPKRSGSRAPRGIRLLSSLAECGMCHALLYLSGRPINYRCTARVRGMPASAHCKPAPGMMVEKLDQAVTEFFLTKFGTKQLMRKVFDPGTGHTAQVAKLEADRRRLREDRAAGLFDSADDAEWFRREYARMGQELDTLKTMPERPAQMRWESTGETVADQWAAAEGDTVRRREILISYGVKVVLYPRGHSPRMWIHTLDPDTEHDALATSAQLDYEARVLADDAEQYAREHAEHQQEARMSFARLIFSEQQREQMAEQAGPTPGRLALIIDEALRDLGFAGELQPFS
jgi:DNA invertase Pin-like site-specific DNA recombinase